MAGHTGTQQKERRMSRRIAAPEGSKRGRREVKGRAGWYGRKKVRSRGRWEEGMGRRRRSLGELDKEMEVEGKRV